MTKFKEGDKVKIIDDSTRQGTGFADGWERKGSFRGKVGYIGDINRADIAVYPTKEAAARQDMHADGGYYGRHQQSALELFEEKTVQDFNIGDRVRIIEGQISGLFGFPTACIATVVEPVIGSKVTVKYGGTKGYANPENIELIKENEMTVTVDSVNDHTIYVVATDSEAFEEGTEVRLTYNDNTNCPKFADLTDSDREYYVGLESLDVFGQPRKKELREVTLEEVADLLGVDVSTVRIKE